MWNDHVQEFSREKNLYFYWTSRDLRYAIFDQECRLDPTSHGGFGLFSEEPNASVYGQ